MNKKKKVVIKRLRKVLTTLKNFFSLQKRKNTEKQTIVIVSGYFNPIHKGHIEYLKNAKKLGNYLIAIVNNDTQVKIKGSILFMDIKERVTILNSIKYVDEVFISIDKDVSVCKSIRELKKRYKNCNLIFAKGGDRTIDNIPEKKVCEELGIKMVFNVGGKKKQSSSTLIEKSIKEYNSLCKRKIK